jgi:uncharacterized membrane protein YtjA (UPF0391 family)
VSACGASPQIESCSSGLKDLSDSMRSGLQIASPGATFAAGGRMRFISGLLLVIAILAAVLWLTVSAAAGLAKIIAALFLVLFILSLFLRRGRAGKL